MKTGLNRKGLTVAAGLCLALAGMGRAQTVPLAKQRVITVAGKQYMLKSKLTSILVGSFTYGFNHTIGYPNLETTLKRIGTAEGWTVDITDPNNHGSEVTAAKLKGYQVFFANYISGWASSGQFPAAGKSAIQDFVETQGGGVFIMHSSGDSGPSNNWPWFNNTAHPVQYQGESSRLAVAAPIFIPPGGKTSPIMEGIGFGAGAASDTFNVAQGEFHQFAHIITAVVTNPTLLLNMNGAKCTNNGTGTNCGTNYNYSIPGGYPAAWAFPDKKGTIGYFMEGHDTYTMQGMGQTMWDKFFKQFMYYMAGYDTTEVTSIGLTPKPGEDIALDASGITFNAENQAGVFISKPGMHVVSLVDMSGRVLKEIRSSQNPVGYDMSNEMRGARGGIYVLRVALPGVVRSKRIFIQ